MGAAYAGAPKAGEWELPWGIVAVILTVQGIKGRYGGVNTLRTCRNTAANSHRRII